MPTAIVKTRDELIDWRTDLLTRARLTQDELYERAQDYTLSPEEHDIYETVRSINYLLGDE